jgi:GAF domain-containing protein
VSPTPLTVLYVDPDEDRWEDVTGPLEARADLEALAVDGLDSARTALDAWQVDCLVSEFDLGTGTALDLFEWAREEAPETGCILFSEVDPAAELGEDAFQNILAEYLPRNSAESTERLVDLVHNVGANSVGVGYPVPDNETDRLAAVRSYDLPNLSTIETFDRLTHLVVDYFDSAVSFIGIVKEEEEEMLACHGADWQVLARDESICAYSMLEEDVTVVEDVQADPRFEDDEGLADAGVAFYAGAPLVTDEGHAVGVFCLHAGAPRSFSERERTLLELLADQAMETLDLYRQVGRATSQPEGETDD